MIDNNQQTKSIISSNIKYLLKSKDKTRKQVAAELEVKYTTFCDWVNGRVVPSYNSLEKLGNYFEIDAVDFYSDIEERKLQNAKRLRAYSNELLKGKVLDIGILDSLDEDQIKNLILSGFRFRHRTLEEYIELSEKPQSIQQEIRWNAFTERNL